MASPPVTAYLGLGSNLGDRRAALTQALALLDAAPGLRRRACSAIYETEPWGVAEQPPFLNLAAAFATTLPPAALLAAAQQVETQVGRRPTYRWGPRRIDIDILLYANRVIAIPDPDLQIPHPRLSQRAFVLVPLAEIAPQLAVPPDGQSILRLLQAVDGAAGVTRWADPPA